jgi:hypothetical protein
MSRSSHLDITCLVYQERFPTWRGDIHIESHCGVEYQTRTGQLVEEPICGPGAKVDVGQFQRSYG